MITGNEPAQPYIRTGDDLVYAGLTIRQEFAARAMQGILSTLSAESPLSKPAAFLIATESVMIADALINELNKTP